MPNLLDNKNFGLKIYKRFPLKYQEDDISQNYALRRYLESLADGGFSPAIEDINRITTLIDPEKIDAKFLPILFEQYGLPILNDIPEEYLRYLLPRLSEAYSQKGTLTAIEFVTSSLSGVKVRLEVIDWELNVKFEMDYSLGESGYFPDAEHFGRIIDKFLPFYFGRNIIYSFVFYEEQVLRAFEQSLVEVTDVKQETGSFFYYKTGVPLLLNRDDKLLNTTFILNPEHEGEEVDPFLDVIKTRSLEDIVVLSREEDDFLLDNLIQRDEVQIDTEEDSTDVLSLVHIEAPKLWAKGKKIIGSALFGEALFGESIFGVYEDHADVTKEKITQKHNEDIGLLQTTESFTNNYENLLNNTLYTNGTKEFMEYSFDVITYSGDNPMTETVVH